MPKHNETANITRMRSEDGQLPAYAFPGGYPLFYVNKKNNILCPKCANENDEIFAPIVDAGVNYEDAQLYCDQCSERIESAYAEDEAEGAYAEDEAEGENS